jgi:hypothetical protein
MRTLSLSLRKQVHFFMAAKQTVPRDGSTDTDVYLRAKKDENSRALFHDGDVGVRGGQQRIAHNVRGVFHPPGCGLVEDLALEGDGGEEPIERRLPISRDDHDAITEIVRVAHLALCKGKSERDVFFTLEVYEK